MTVELLYLPGCPNHQEAADLVRNVLQEEGVVANLIEISVCGFDEVKARGFPGSPTLRVNGRDIEDVPSAGLPIGFACRTYSIGGKQQGVPPRSWLERAIRAARTLEESQP
jgi:hypothetical protein